MKPIQLLRHTYVDIHETSTCGQFPISPAFSIFSHKSKIQTIMIAQSLNDLSFLKMNTKRSMHHSFSTLSTCDDYGEEDLYLQSYRTEASSTSGSISSTSTSTSGSDVAPPCQFALHEANAKLEERLAEFKSEDMQQQSTSRSSDRTLLVASSSLSIGLQICKDSSKKDVVVISAVVHDTNNAKVLNVNNKKVQLQGSYSLMTKMMKHNTALQRASNCWGDAEASHIGVCGGKIMFVANVNTSTLSNKRKFGMVLDEFASKASAFSNDFAQRSESAKSRLNRRKCLMKAYNKTIL
jgi:hypothetical protein